MYWPVVTPVACVGKQFLRASQSAGLSRSLGAIFPAEVGFQRVASRRRTARHLLQGVLLKQVALLLASSILANQLRMHD